MTLASGKSDIIRENLVIHSAERLRCSVNGNPRFLIRFTDGSSAQTQSDASVGYDIENFTMSRHEGRLMRGAFTRAGKIRALEFTDEFRTRKAWQAVAHDDVRDGVFATVDEACKHLATAGEPLRKVVYGRTVTRWRTPATTT